MNLLKNTRILSKDAFNLIFRSGRTPFKARLFGLNTLAIFALNELRNSELNLWATYQRKRRHKRILNSLRDLDLIK